ncbi:MAG: hypothetical protein U5P41_10155 [Gammaproteobacteria bacterium]|nr:hypothetical protein [Gammaproteobacteria bacterium]
MAILPEMNFPRPRSIKNLFIFHEIAFLLLVLVTGLIGGLSAYFWQETSQESVRINNLAALNEQVRSNLFRQIQTMIRARVLEEPQAVKRYADYSRQIDEHFNDMRGLVELDREISAIEALQESYRILQKDMNNIFRDPYMTQTARINMIDPRFAEQMVRPVRAGLPRFQGNTGYTAGGGRCHRRSLGTTGADFYSLGPAVGAGAAAVYPLQPQARFPPADG